MNRSEVIAKIQKLLALKEGSSFENEAANAAAMIDKLSKEHGINVETINDPEIMNETLETFRRMNPAHFRILSAVARFYDAMVYTKGKAFQIIGSEAQIIQTQLYSQYIKDCMESEVDKAYLAEKTLAQLTGSVPPTATFRHQFRAGFATAVAERLRELKGEQNRVHEHAKFAATVINSMRFRSVSITSGRGEGSISGQSAGHNVSLHRQTSGAGPQKQLAGF
jgi:Protein of unknown function (DUF2786)